MLLKDQKNNILLQSRGEERHPTGKFFWFCLKSFLLRNNGPMDSSACFTFQSSSKLHKTFTVKEIKIDDQIRDLIKHTLRVQNFYFLLFMKWSVPFNHNCSSKSLNATFASGNSCVCQIKWSALQVWTSLATEDTDLRSLNKRVTNLTPGLDARFVPKVPNSSSVQPQGNPDNPKNIGVPIV